MLIFSRVNRIVERLTLLKSFPKQKANMCLMIAASGYILAPPASLPSKTEIRYAHNRLAFGHCLDFNIPHSPVPQR